MASDKNYGITVHQEKTGTHTQLVHSVVMVLEPRMVRTNLLSVLDGFSPIEDGYEMVARAWLDGVVVACFTKQFKAAPVDQ
jgi:hypothetical protein